MPSVVRSRWYLAAAAVVALVAGAVFLMNRDDAPEPAPVATLPLPTSMAALGDSITAGVGASPDGFDASPQHSWATGDADDDVTSHYERLIAAGASIQGQSHNVAVPGATMADGPAQAAEAVATGATYVTIMLGGNDVCMADTNAMTPVADFERDFRATLDALARGLPRSHFFVISVPDVHQLWEAFEGDPIAQRIWGGGRVCGAMLDPGNGDAERAAARDRTIAFNQVLETVCATQARCRFDNNAFFEQDLDPDLVALDRFHPSQQGHAVIAELTWRYGFWPDR